MTEPITHRTETEPAGWRSGQRVARKGTGELGTIVAANGKIKVKWDGGRTSYYGPEDRINVQLKEAD
jgi:hypothetical protein